MALTSLDAIFKLESTEIGYTIKDGEAPSSGETYPLYIPRIMPGIEMGEPKTSKIPTNGASVYKNSSQCAIRCDSLLNSVNYIDVKFEGNTKWTSSKANIDPTTGSRLIKKGLQVTCHNTTNVIEDMSFSNN